ncbi:hypothetical protein J2785_007135 [Burkholderia ambifaria]|nr:hypothetical protein [Burkholderia ambifaria]
MAGESVLFTGETYLQTKPPIDPSSLTCDAVLRAACEQ